MCVNGVQIPLEKPQTLLGFLKEQGYNIHRIAVERCHQGKLLERKDWRIHRLLHRRHCFKIISK